MRYLTLDVETERWASEVHGGFKRPQDFGVACCCYAIHQDETFLEGHTFVPPRHAASIETVLPETFAEHLREADRIVTFNGETFDFQVLRGEEFDVELLYPKSIDILRAFSAVVGHRIKLDSLANTVLDKGKGLDGVSAVNIWKAGILLQSVANQYGNLKLKGMSVDCFSEVITYCKKDVALTWQLYQAIKNNNNQVAYWNWNVSRDVVVTLDLEPLNQEYDAWKKERSQY